MPTKYCSFLILISAVLACNTNTRQREKINVSRLVHDSTTIIKTAFHIKYETKATTAYSGVNYKVTFPIDVQIKSIAVSNDEYVQKGQKLCSIQHPKLINIQQDYLTTVALFNQHKSNFNRQGELAIEQATSIKLMEKHQAFYLQYEAQKKALENTLKLLQIDPEKISIDNILTEIEIKAPAEGVASLQSHYVGELIKSGEPVLKITNTKQLALDVPIPSCYYPFVNTGDSIVVIPWNDNIDTLFLSVQSMDIKISENQTFNIRSNDFVNGNLPENFRLQTYAIISTPKQYCVKSDFVLNNKYLIVKKNEITDTVQVNPGISNNGFTQLINVQNKILESVVIKPSL